MVWLSNAIVDEMKEASTLTIVITGGKRILINASAGIVLTAIGQYITSRQSKHESKKGWNYQGR